MKKVKKSTTFIRPTEENINEFEDNFLKQYSESSQNSSFFKNVFYICNGYYWSIAVVIIFCTLQLSLLLFLPIATSEILNALVYHADNPVPIIAEYFLISVGLLIINYPLQKIYMRRLNALTRSIEVKLRDSLIRKLQRMTIAFSKHMPSGKIQSKIMRDVEQIRASIYVIIVRSTHVIVELTTVLAVITIKGCWQLLLFFLACVPPFVIVVRRMRKKIREKNRNYRIKMEKSSSKVIDMIDLIPVTKAHSIENYEINRMSKLMDETSNAGYEIDCANNKFSVVSWLIVQVANLLALLFIVFLAYKKLIKIGDIVLYQTYFNRLIATVTSVLDVLPTIIMGSEAINSVAEILKSNQVEKSDNKKIIKDLKGDFEFKHVGFNYEDDEKMVLGDLTLDIKAGETVAFVGESGAGKSTVINLLTGFYFPTKGEILVDGNNIKDINLNSYRQNIAMVPQNSILFSGTVRENITYGSPKIREEFLQQIIDLSCLRNVIEELPNGLDTYIGEHGFNLSGGQRQRISIARALIRNPKVIIFDEATSALDTVSERYIQMAIDNLSKDKTTFIVAHRLSTIKNADKIAVIEGGKCIEFGTFDELVAKKGAFYKFRQLQI